jgi:mono/diheme cytochrome c family protein
MQTFKIFMAVAVFYCTVLIYACTANEAGKSKNGDKDVTAQHSMSGDELIARGEYLLTVAGCNDCHSPKIFSEKGMLLDSSKLYSGHPATSKLPPPDKNALKPGQWGQLAPDVTAFVGPWGISYAANLTPDSATGIGAWTEEIFVRTLRTGKHLGQEGGRPILPPMPWFNVAKMTDEDLKAAYAYLRSVPPVSNRVPAPKAPPELMAKK